MRIVFTSGMSQFWLGSGNVTQKNLFAFSRRQIGHLNCFEYINMQKSADVQLLQPNSLLLHNVSFICALKYDNHDLKTVGILANSF